MSSPEDQISVINILIYLVLQKFITFMMNMVV